ncbi:uncharacterized protein LOC103308727 [Acyrthosiphon pisum]|uniref:THAP-type domain-containing protein n=1 Tax=Acyrthosiphon pisum TaxID=7029 RepID=A0A8R2F6J8_ACYPI|nr:uncharacterized protein LOC103308727 [Acyrthosiphon pisum]|eukprot:XP_008180890.1 PREDICTED: uncharacterized protein LOC103308727 [Acyrthosiphon pisum]
MHKCILCDKKSDKKKFNRPVVRFHRFPKDEYKKRKWLKAIGIDRCHEWQCVCSDHFLEENYKRRNSGIFRGILLRNAIPQPYDRNGFPSNHATQSNDVETGNNVILPMETNMIREEHIENAAVYRNNVDMPDHTSGSGLRCSVKNCFNRHSKNLTLFGYPKDFTLRKNWIEKCGTKKDPAKIVKSSTKVCSTHFEPECFTNTTLKNRLKPGAVPSLFFNSDW